MLVTLLTAFLLFCNNGILLAVTGFQTTIPLQGSNSISLSNKMIAHAGGGVNGVAYSNSLQALNENYKKGYRYFEMDIEWTSDMELVMLHDWKEKFQSLYNTKPRILTLKDFKKLKMVKGLSQLTLDQAMTWFKQHPDAYLITDIKRGNYIRTIGSIKSRYPQQIKQVIPQIYYVSQYNIVQNMGFQNIIFTIYRLNLKDDEYIKSINQYKMKLLTIPTYKANPSFLAKLKKTGINLSIHTVNSIKEIINYRKLGVSNFYTDFCTP